MYNLLKRFIETRLIVYSEVKFIFIFILMNIFYVISNLQTE